MPDVTGFSRHNTTIAVASAVSSLARFVVEASGPLRRFEPAKIAKALLGPVVASIAFVAATASTQAQQSTQDPALMERVRYLVETAARRLPSSPSSTNACALC